MAVRYEGEEETPLGKLKLQIGFLDPRRNLEEFAINIDVSSLSFLSVYFKRRAEYFPW